MNNLAPDPAGCRDASSTDDLRNSDAAETMVAKDVGTRVDAAHSSSEVVRPNPLRQIGDPPSVSTDTDRAVETLRAEVGQLAEMFRAFMAQQSPATPPNLSAASTSPEVLNAQQC